MSSSALPEPNAPTLSTEQLADVPPVSPTGVPITAPPPSDPPFTTEARVAKSTNDVSPVSITVAQAIDPLGGASAVVDNVPEPVPADPPKSQTTTEVQLPTESTPAVKTADAINLTDDNDDVELMTSGEVLADVVLGASTYPTGMSYYFLVFFFSSYHSFLIRHVAPSHVPVFPNMVLLI